MGYGLEGQDVGWVRIWVLVGAGLLYWQEGYFAGSSRLSSRLGSPGLRLHDWRTVHSDCALFPVIGV